MKNHLVKSILKVENISFILFILLAIGLIIYISFQPWAYRKTGDGVGIAVFPIIFLIGIAIFSTTALIGTYKETNSKKCEQEKKENDDSIVEWRYMILLAVVTIVASLILRYIDPLVIVSVLGVAILLIARVREWTLIITTAVGLMLFVYIFIIRLAEIYFTTSWFF